MRDFFKIAMSFFRGNPIAAKIAAGVGVLVLAAIIISLWPPSPAATIDRYVSLLRKNDCASAYELIAKDRKEEDINVETVRDFKETVCDPVKSDFVKIFVDPDNIKWRRVAGGDATVTYNLCVLPDGFVRRVCTKHDASLTKEGMHWKIMRVDIGNWHSPHDFRMEKVEDLVPSYSILKHQRTR
jgi:hypothetical protein